MDATFLEEGQEQRRESLLELDPEQRNRQEEAWKQLAQAVSDDEEDVYENDESEGSDDEPLGWDLDASDDEDGDDGTRGLGTKIKNMFRRERKPTADTFEDAGAVDQAAGQAAGGAAGQATPPPGQNPVSDAASGSDKKGKKDQGNRNNRPAAGQDIPLPKVLGPCLRFVGYEPSSRLYTASCLVVTQDSAGFSWPVLSYWDPTHDTAETTVPAEMLDSYGGYTFWRFNIYVVASEEQRSMEYHVSCIEAKGFQFYVAGAYEKWNWGFYSCNGFHDPVVEKKFGGIQPLWHDVAKIHTTKTKMHVMVGGGDQLYNDNVWELSSLKAWTDIKKPAERLTKPFTPEMETEVSTRYFENYMRHWDQHMFAETMSIIPQVMMWDDHDIFDGWGSYPPELQECSVFQGVFKFAQKFYLLFQQHTTEERVKSEQCFFGEAGWSWLGHFGATTGRKQIVRPATWDMAKSKLNALPPSVRHVVVVATVPVIYPKVKIMESTIEYLAKKGKMQKMIQKMLQKSGLAGGFYSQFGEPEIWDDLLDHWGADVHHEEKLAMVTMLQDLSKSKGIRVSFLSGDVHVAAAAKFESRDKKLDPAADHRLMYQVISSAIGNEPPPASVVRVLNMSAKKTNLNKDTRELPVNLYSKRRMMIKGARNWCLVTETDNTGTASLNFHIRVEGMGENNGKIHVYDLPVIPLGQPRVAIPGAPATTTAAGMPPGAMAPMGAGAAAAAAYVGYASHSADPTFPHAGTASYLHPPPVAQAGGGTFYPSFTSAQGDSAPVSWGSFATSANSGPPLHSFGPPGSMGGFGAPTSSEGFGAPGSAAYAAGGMPPAAHPPHHHGPGGLPPVHPQPVPLTQSASLNSGQYAQQQAWQQPQGGAGYGPNSAPQTPSGYGPPSPGGGLQSPGAHGGCGPISVPQTFSGYGQTSPGGGFHPPGAQGGYGAHPPTGFQPPPVQGSPYGGAGQPPQQTQQAPPPTGFQPPPAQGGAYGGGGHPPQQTQQAPTGFGAPPPGGQYMQAQPYPQMQMNQAGSGMWPSMQSYSQQPHQQQQGQPYSPQPGAAPQAYPQQQQQGQPYLPQAGQHPPQGGYQY
eukprot:gene30774-35813_t